MPLIAVLVGAVAFTALLFISVLFGTVIGAFAGWVVGLVFTDTMITLAKMLGQPGMEAWQLGAILGFVGSFFRSSSSSSK